MRGRPPRPPSARPGRSQPICTIRGHPDRGGRRERLVGRQPGRRRARRRCRGGSGCPRPGAAAAPARAAGCGRGPRPAGCGSVRSCAARAAACARRRRRRAWAARPAAPRRGSRPCGSAPASSSSATSAASDAGSVGTSAAVGAPSTTIVTSPRTPSAAQAARSASPPRRTSSWVLVSSRHTAPRRSSPNALGHRGERGLGPVRRLEEHHRPRLVAPARRAAGTARPALRGRNPSKQNRSTGSPETASAVSTADGPGHRGDRDVPLDRGGDEPVAGVRHRRHPGVGHQQHPLAGLERLDERRRCGSTRCPRSRTPPGRAPSTPRSVVSRSSRRVSSAATTSAVGELLGQPRRGVRDPADRGRGQHQHAGRPRRLAVPRRDHAARHRAIRRRRPYELRRDRHAAAAPPRRWGSRAPRTTGSCPSARRAARAAAPRDDDRFVGWAATLGGHAARRLPAAVEPRPAERSSSSTRPTTPRTPGRCWHHGYVTGYVDDGQRQDPRRAASTAC